MENRNVVLISVISALGGLLFGFDTAVISGTIAPVRDHFLLGVDMEGWFVSSALVGCMIGVSLSGMASDAFGRKKVLLASAIFFLVSAVGSALAGLVSSLVFYRIIGGTGIGIASILSPLYIAELSPSKLRGRLVALYQLAITIGILSAYLSNAAIVQIIGAESKETWRWMFGMEAAPALLFLFMLFYIPESPRWLLSKNKIEKARVILNQYLPAGEAADQIRFSEEEQLEKSRFWDIMKNRSLLWLLLIGALLASFSQLSGINAIIYYGPDILSNAGLTLSDSLGGQVTIGMVNVLFTFLAIWKIDAWGRKPLLLSGIIGVFLSLVMCGSYFFYGMEQPFLIIIFITAFIACFAFSYGPVTWIIISEIYPTKVRGTAMSIATLSLWLTNVLIAQVFPRMNAWSEWGAFVVFAGITLVAFFFVRFFIPETKNKSLEEIEKHLISAEIH
ncbi:MAG: sugar porter family MFS transporter [Saprospiraceae bacterium]|nr:sugar porter family MFS transporter [Saprospiraceae bacterium]MCB9325921.1 sugar porter family MFS transporter [Lewinellaceae bacterium]